MAVTARGPLRHDYAGLLSDHHIDWSISDDRLSMRQ